MSLPTAPLLADEAGVRRFVEHVMGMPISLALRGRHAETPAGARAWQAALASLRDADLIFSTYRSDSVISRYGRGELALEACPPEVAEVLDLGRQAELESGGAFAVTRTAPGGETRLDPSGVVKGWAVERAARALAPLEATDYCLSAGGDMVCHTARPDAAPWRVGIEHPLHPARLIAVVPVNRGAVATSGTQHRGSHLVDARTGLPPSGVASVTVIGEALTWVDIDATAAYALGTEAADWLRGRPGRSALIVWSDATTTVVDGRRPAPDRPAPA